MINYDLEALKMIDVVIIHAFHIYNFNNVSNQFNLFKSMHYYFSQQELKDDKIRNLE